MTTTHIFIKQIYDKVEKYDNKIIIIIMKKFDKLFNIIIDKINIVKKYDIYNVFLEDSILKLIGIYSNIKKNDLNFENFNEKIIPIAKKIFKETETIENKLKILIKYIKMYKILSRNRNFFVNLVYNIKLKELFISIVNKYISLETEKEEINNFFIIIKNYYEFLVIYMNKKKLKNVHFEIIDCFVQDYIIILDTGIFENERFQLIIFFLDSLFKNEYYLKNIINLEVLINPFEKIQEKKLYLLQYEKNMFLYIIFLYTEYILKNPGGNENFSEIVRIFKNNNKEKFLKIIREIIKELKKKPQNSIYNICIYYYIKNNLNNIYIESNKLNNEKLEKEIIIPIQEHKKNNLFLELENVSNYIKDILNNHCINDFYIKKDITVLEKIIFKNIFKNDIIKTLKNFHNKIKDQKTSIIINFQNKDKNFLKFVLIYDFFDMEDKNIRDLVYKLSSDHFHKSFGLLNDLRDFKFYFILIFYITNLVEKDKIIDKNSIFSFKEVTIFPFETEMKEFIYKKDDKGYEKLSIVKLINIIANSKLEILEILEYINKEKYKNLMIDFINGFQTLFIFVYPNRKKKSKIWKTIYKNFTEIFSDKNNERIKIFYWQKTKTRKEIHEYLKKIFPSFISNIKNDFEESKRKKMRLEKLN